MNKHIIFRIFVISICTAFVWLTFPFLYRFYLIAIPAFGFYYLLKKLNLFSDQKEPYIRLEDQTWKDKWSKSISSFLSEFLSIGKTAILTVSGIIILVLICMYFISNTLKTKRTQAELSEIVSEIGIFKSKNNRLPENLEEIIARNPLKNSWKVDFWNNPIKYIKSSNGNSYSISSLGKDGLANTKDDLVLNIF